MRRKAAALVAVLAVSLAGVLLFPVVASAAYNPFEQVCSQGGGGPACTTNANDNPLLGPQGALNQVITILSIILGAVSIIFVIWGGIKYVTSNGDSSSISTAKSTIIYALIGLVLAAVARPLINFVISRI